VLGCPDRHLGCYSCRLLLQWFHCSKSSWAEPF